MQEKEKLLIFIMNFSSNSISAVFCEYADVFRYQFRLIQIRWQEDGDWISMKQRPSVGLYSAKTAYTEWLQVKGYNRLGGKEIKWKDSSFP